MLKTITQQTLSDVLDLLRFEESDNQYFEVKAAAGGFPETVIKTICAFANTPGGGVIIFGVDENLSFEVVGVYDPKACQQVLANYSKKEFTIPIEITTTLLNIGGKKVVWAEVSEADKMLKPVKIKKGNRAFIRRYDGDFELSPQEEELFVSARGPSLFDEAPVPGTDTSELNKDLKTAFIENRKSLSSTLSKMNDNEVLLRSGVLTQNGELTKAGLLTMGIYPQQFLPNYSIKASVQKKSYQTDRVRAVNVRSFDGPIPVILEEAVKWVSDNCDELTLDLPSGHVRTVKTYPPIVARELIANSLIHRDLSPMSMVQTISLIIEDGRLLISNPGGLYGLHVNELGRTGSKTRNTRIAEICQYIQTEGGMNVIEKLGSGIPKIKAELSELSMPEPIFIDGGVYFTVILNSLTAKNNMSKETMKPVGNDALILASLKKEPKSKADLQAMTKLTYGQTKYSIEKLMASGKIYKLGKNRSPNTRYALVSDD